MSAVVFVFVDGLGLGDPDSPGNPLRDPALSLLANFLPRGWHLPPDGVRPEPLPDPWRPTPLPPGAVVRATDASLGMAGLPQSATGQTTILTGENAARAIGRHLYGFPTPSLQKILLRSSVLKRVADAGKRAVFANAFRPLFFELGDAVWSKRMSATTWANHAAGLRFRSVDDLAAGQAVYQDITNETLRARGIPAPLRTPEEAGEILVRVAREHEFTLFEFFQTDKAGHAQDEAWARRELQKLERFLGAVVSGLDPRQCTLILTSDHGNIEDLGVKTHTRNPVPTLVRGRNAAAVAARLDRLEAFTPVMLEELGIREGGA